MGFIRSFRRQMNRQMKQREIAAEKRSRKVRFEPLEPRLLLSADLNQGAGEMIPDMLDAMDLRSESLQTGLTDRSQRSFIDMHGDINGEAIKNKAIKNELGQITAEQAEGVAQIIFVDPAVHDHETLIEGLMPGNGSDTQVTLLDSDLDGMQQITEALEFYDDVESLHILSHGSSGSLTLGNTSLTSDTIGSYTPQLTAWSDALGEDADILLYGCNVAKGVAGIEFVQNLSEITGAEIAASTDDTGAAELGGDWSLEYSTGVVSSARFDTFIAGRYPHLLANFKAPTDNTNWTQDGTSGADTMTGFDGNDTIGGLGGNDTIYGGKGNDTLKGGPGDDMYKFQPDWGQDTVTEHANEGMDTLDFTLVRTALTININGVGNVQITDTTNNKRVTANGNVEYVKAGKGTNTLDLSGLNDALTVTIKNDKNVIVAKTSAPHTEIIKVNNVANIIGGQQNDHFILERGATLDGYLDGGLGDNNTLDYEGTNPYVLRNATSYSAPVEVDLSNNDNTKFTATGFKRLQEGGIKNIQEVTGGKKNDTISGYAGNENAKFKNETFIGAKGDDTLDGGRGTDTLEGQAGNDTLIGGKENDTLAGGTGNDTYKFAASWGTDTITENANEGTDTLDFSAIAGVLNFEIRKIDATADGGIKLTSTTHGQLQRYANKPGVQHIEQVVGGQQENTFKIYPDWGKRIVIETPLKGKTNLDFSNLPTESKLGINIYPADKSHSQAANKVIVTDGTNWLYAYHVYDIKGGQGENTYRFWDGGLLAGQLDDGPGQNILDYSKYDRMATVNLTDVAKTDQGTTTIKQVKAGVQAVDEQWRFTLPVNLTGGTYTLSLGNNTTDPINHNAVAATIQGKLEKIYGTGLVTVTVAEAVSTFDVTFKVTLENPKLPPQLRANGSKLMPTPVGVATQASIAEDPYGDKHIWHDGHSGTFGLELGGHGSREYLVRR